MWGMRNRILHPLLSCVLLLALGLVSCQLAGISPGAESVNVSSGSNPEKVTSRPTTAAAAGETKAAGEASPAPTATRPAPAESDPEGAASDSPAAEPPTPEPEQCLEQEGALLRFSLRSPVLEDTLRGRMYLPPCYGRVEKAYPVLYLFHGLMATEQQWLALDIKDKADSLIREDRISPLIIVMPREEAWGLPPDNLYGQAVIQDLIPWMDEHYRTRDEKGGRALGGISRGGNWALRLGLMNWEEVGAVGAHSAPLFYGQLSRITQSLEAIPRAEMPRIYLDTGEDDQQAEFLHTLQAELKRRGIPHDWYLHPGLHHEDYWREHLADYLRWYSQSWDAS